MNAFSLENLHINMCMQIHMLFCYGYSFLLHYRLPWRSETVSVTRGYGRTGRGRREQGKINSNTAYCALTEVDWCVGVISKGQDTQNLNIGLSSYKKALKALPT